MQELQLDKDVKQFVDAMESLAVADDGFFWQQSEGWRQSEKAFQRQCMVPHEALLLAQCQKTRISRSRRFNPACGKG